MPIILACQLTFRLRIDRNYFPQENQNRLHSKSDSYAQRNKILKETKAIPRVVYEIEQFNKEVLLLGKRTGVSINY